MPSCPALVIFLQQSIHSLVMAEQHPGLAAVFICFILFSVIMPPKVETTELAPEEED